MCGGAKSSDGYGPFAPLSGAPCLRAPPCGRCPPPQGTSTSDATYEITTLLGRRDDPLHELCARQLSQALAPGDSTPAQPLLVTLALPKLTQQGVRQAVDQVVPFVAALRARGQ